jgi:hypothetical protein
VTQRIKVNRCESGEYTLVIGDAQHTLTESEAASLFGQLQRWVGSKVIGIPCRPTNQPPVDPDTFLPPPPAPTAPPKPRTPPPD